MGKMMINIINFLKFVILINLSANHKLISSSPFFLFARFPRGPFRPCVKLGVIAPPINYSWHFGKAWPKYFIYLFGHDLITSGLLRKKSDQSNSKCSACTRRALRFKSTGCA